MVRHDGGVVDDSPGMYLIGHAVPAPAQVELHRRRARRRARPRATTSPPTSTRTPAPTGSGRALADHELERCRRPRRHGVRTSGARGVQQLDRAVGSEHASAASHRPQARRSPQPGNPAAHASARGRSNPPERETRQPRAATSRGRPRSRRTSGPTRSRMRRCRDSSVIACLRNVMRSASPAPSTFARARSSDGSQMSMPTMVVGGHTFAALTASKPTPVPTSRKLVTSARSGCGGLDDGRHHHRATSPSVEDDRVGERPACRTAGRFDELVRLMDASLAMLASIICCGGGSSSRPVRPAASSTSRSASATSGGASVPDCCEGEMGAERGERLCRGAPLHDVGHHSSNVMSRMMHPGASADIRGSTSR